MIQPAFASSALEALQAEAHQKKLADRPMWRRLLHDRRNLLGRYQSEIGDPSFLLPPSGRRAPAGELDATLKASLDSAPPREDAQPAACRFPARYAWLKEQLPFDAAAVPEPSCPRFEKW